MLFFFFFFFFALSSPFLYFLPLAYERPLDLASKSISMVKKLAIKLKENIKGKKRQKKKRNDLGKKRLEGIGNPE